MTPDRDIIPTRSQINAIDDISALVAIREDIERRIIQMETDLEFRLDDAEWANRARKALSIHRYAERLIGRRIGALKTSPAAKGGGQVRPDEENDPLTLEVLNKRPEVNPAELVTVQAVDEASGWLVARINATTTDRDDEIGLAAGERDEGFLASTGSVLRHMRGLRMALQTRRGEISKAEKAAAEAGRQASRERQFIDAARTVLDKDTFLRIWDLVYRLEGPAAEVAA